jgi:ABC-2 type transport system permease protein
MKTITGAYLRRDWLVWVSYRLSAIWQFTGVFILVVGVVMVGGSLGSGTHDLGGSSDYASFVLAGLAFTDVFFAGLTSPPRAVSDGQTTGTLEPILLTPIRTWQFMTSSSVLRILLSVVRTSLIIAAAVVFLGYWHRANVPAALAIFVVAFLTFLGLGLVAAAFTMVVKQGDPVVVAYVALSGLLGGTVIPVAALPPWLQSLAALLPLTHALDGMRHALDGAGYAQLFPQFAILTITTVLFLPFGLYASYWATRRARREGSLVHY